MPLFRCPHCRARVRVVDHQVGKLLTCPKCGGRFIADPGLPSDIHVEDYDPVEVPPVQGGASGPSEDPPRPPREQPAGPFDRGPIPRVVPVIITPEMWKGADTRFGWGLVVTMIVLELLAVVVAFAFAAADSERFRLVCVIIIGLLILVHSVLWVVAIFHVVAQSRTYIESVAPWLLVLATFQGLGLIFYLVSRPRPHER
jgi:predicted Zn finger-like uncharacterized protein